MTSPPSNTNAVKCCAMSARPYSISWIAWIAAILILPTAAGVAADARGKSAEVHGTLSDYSDARIPQATLRFTRRGAVTTVKTGPAGTYSVHLAPGTYAVTAEASGFCRQPHSDISVVHDSTAELNFGLVEARIVDRIEAHPSQEGLPPPPRIDSSEDRKLVCGYDEETLARPPHSSIHPFILFGDRIDDASQVRYESATYTARKLQVIMTFAFTTIRADKIVYDPRSPAFEATGHVSWEDGTRTLNGSIANITFHRGAPVVNLAP